MNPDSNILLKKPLAERPEYCYRGSVADVMWLNYIHKLGVPFKDFRHGLKALRRDAWLLNMMKRKGISAAAIDHKRRFYDRWIVAPVWEQLSLF